MRSRCLKKDLVGRLLDHSNRATLLAIKGALGHYSEAIPARKHTICESRASWGINWLICPSWLQVYWKELEEGLLMWLRDFDGNTAVYVLEHNALFFSS